MKLLMLILFVLFGPTGTGAHVSRTARLPPREDPAGSIVDVDPATRPGFLCAHHRWPYGQVVPYRLTIKECPLL